MATKAKTPTFEEGLARIDELVRALEQGSAPLEQSLALFEEGAGLIKACAAMLDKAEQKVLRLSKGADGQPEETPFDAGE